MCSIDSQTTSSDCPSEPRFDEDPYGPIKISLEKTIQLLHLEESLVDNFLVKGHKKLVIQTKFHPRPSVLIRQHAEIMYEVGILEKLCCIKLRN